MSYISAISSSCGSRTAKSSKRIIMYHFLYVSIFMVLIQAAFTLILIYKWANAADGESFEIYSVFPDVIWYCVFGIIGGIAGVNGVQNGFGKQTTPVPDEVV